MNTFEEKLVHYTGEMNKIGLCFDRNRLQAHVDSLPADPPKEARSKNDAARRLFNDLDPSGCVHSAYTVNLANYEWGGKVAGTTKYIRTHLWKYLKHSVGLEVYQPCLYVAAVLAGETWVRQAYEEGEDLAVHFGDRIGEGRDLGRMFLLNGFLFPHGYAFSEERSRFDSICPRIAKHRKEVCEQFKSQGYTATFLLDKFVPPISGSEFLGNHSGRFYERFLRANAQMLTWMAFVKAWENGGQIRGVRFDQFLFSPDHIHSVRSAWKNVHPKFKFQTQLRTYNLPRED